MIVLNVNNLLCLFLGLLSSSSFLLLALLSAVFGRIEEMYASKCSVCKKAEHKVQF